MIIKHFKQGKYHNKRNFCSEIKQILMQTEFRIEIINNASIYNEGIWLHIDAIAATGVGAWMSNYNPQRTMDAIIYKCYNIS